MASTTPHNIVIRTNEEGGQRPVYDDYLAAVAITPGELIELDGSQAIIPHGTADGGVFPKMFAVESPYIDASVAKIAHDYAIGENVRYVIPQPGDIIYAWCTASAVLDEGNSVLVSDGAGALKVATLGAGTLETAVVGVPLESKTVGGTRERTKVLIV